MRFSPEISMRKLLLVAAVAAAVLPGLARAEERVQATTKQAEMMVRKAIGYLEKEGKEKALAAFNDPKGPFTYLDLYILALDLEGTVVAHGRNQKLLGQNDVNRKDAQGNYHFARRMLELGKTQGKGWVEYEFENPQSHQVETKVAYVERAGDLIVVCGVYKPRAK
jgi:signal transduction histidine kinase